MSGATNQVYIDSIEGYGLESIYVGRKNGE